MKEFEQFGGKGKLSGSNLFCINNTKVIDPKTISSEFNSHFVDSVSESFYESTKRDYMKCTINPVSNTFILYPLMLQILIIW